LALDSRWRTSALQRGAVTHATLRSRWSQASRARVAEHWEDYWCHSVSPVFFGRSARPRRTKEEAAVARAAAT
ncbi:unnamed protein product, partial [Phaeothamnion confervicola]